MVRYVFFCGTVEVSNDIWMNPGLEYIENDDSGVRSLTEIASQAANTSSLLSQPGALSCILTTEYGSDRYSHMLRTSQVDKKVFPIIYIQLIEAVSILSKPARLVRALLL